MLSELLNHPLSGPFLHPVLAENAPGYYDVIRFPMDLHTISQSFEENLYDIENSFGHKQLDLAAFVADIRKVWTNCLTYNQPDSDLSRSAKTLSNLFERLLVAMMQSNAMAGGGTSSSFFPTTCSPLAPYTDVTEEGHWCGSKMLPVFPTISREDVNKKFREAEAARREGQKQSSRADAGLEYTDDESRPVCLRSPWDYVDPISGSCNLSRLAVARGELEALEVMSELHNSWSDAELMTSVAVRHYEDEQSDQGKGWFDKASLKKESNASKESSQMVAMKNASDKSKEVAHDLTRLFNKIRQAAITREVSEIVGGREALAE